MNTPPRSPEESPERQRSSVVFPVPFMPRTAVTAPAGMVRLTPSSTRRGPNPLDRPSSLRFTGPAASRSSWSGHVPRFPLPPACPMRGFRVRSVCSRTDDQPFHSCSAVVRRRRGRGRRGSGTWMESRERISRPDGTGRQISSHRRRRLDSGIPIHKRNGRSTPPGGITARRPSPSVHGLCGGGQGHRHPLRPWPSPSTSSPQSPCGRPPTEGRRLHP